MTIIQQVAQRHGQIISGVYQSASHRIVPVSDCMIEDTVADEIIVTIRSLLKSFKIHPYDEDTGRGTLRHVLVRRGLRSGEILVVLVTAHGMPPGKRNFVRALLQRHPDITTIVQNINAGQTSLVLGPHSEVLYGPGYIHEQLGDFTFRISPRAFQDLIYLLVALGVSVVLFFPFVRQIIGRSKRVFDALMRIMDAAGLGIFTITGLNTAITLAGCTDPLLLVFVGRLSGRASCIIVFPALGHIVPKLDVKKRHMNSGRDVFLCRCSYRMGAEIPAQKPDRRSDLMMDVSRNTAGNIHLFSSGSTQCAPPLDTAFT